jgi:hypothetical protein
VGSGAPVDLNITVGFADGSPPVPLADALPLRPGNDVQVRCAVPAGHHPALFWLDATGALSQNDLERLPDSPPGMEHWPR